MFSKDPIPEEVLADESCLALTQGLTSTSYKVEIKKNLPNWGKVLEQKVQAIPGIQQLIFNEKKLSLRDLIEIANFLRMNTEVQKLQLRGCQVDDIGAKALAASLKDNTRLLELNLTNNCISGVGAKALILATQNNTSLRTLELPRNHISENEAGLIADALKMDIHLKKLDLQENHLGLGLIQIAEAIKTNDSLISLKVSTFEPWLRSQKNAVKCALYRAVKYNDRLSNFNGHEFNQSYHSAESMLEEDWLYACNRIIKLFYQYPPSALLPLLTEIKMPNALSLLILSYIGTPKVLSLKELPANFFKHHLCLFLEI